MDKAVNKEQKTVLVVDDDADFVELIRTRLEASGYHVDHCVNGVEAIKYFQQKKPSVVILDMEMPDKNGLATLYEFKQKFSSSKGATSKKSLDVPVIVATGVASGTLKELVKDAGIYDFLKKPFSSQDLTQKIDRAVREHAPA